MCLVILKVRREGGEERKRRGFQFFVIQSRYYIIDSERKCTEQVALNGTKRNPWDHL